MVRQKIVDKNQHEENKKIIEPKEKDNLNSCLDEGSKSYVKLKSTVKNEDLADIVKLSECSGKSLNDLNAYPNTLNRKNIQNITENFTKSLKPIINSANSINNLIGYNLSSQLQNFTKSLNSIVMPSYFNFSNNISEIIKPIVSMHTEIINNSLTSIVNQLNPMQQIVKNISDALKPITIQLADSLPKISDYFGELYRTIEKIRENPDSILNWMEYSNRLSEYIWTIPYQISSDELKYLIENVNSEKEFDKYMIKYFTKTKVDNLFSDILFRLNRKHKTIMKQIKDAYFNKSYALANVGILSIIDELCSQFLEDKGCVKRQDILLPIIEEIDYTSNDPFEVLPIMVLNDNINVIYETVDFNKRIKIKTHKKIRRNPSQHGQSFSNRKIDTLMLLNTVYYLLITMENYKQYIGKIIYVKNQKEISYADVSHSNDVKRFYIKKKYVRKK